MSKIQREEAARLRDTIRRLSVRTFPANTDGFDSELNELKQVDQRVSSNLDEFYTGSLGSSMAKNRFDDVKPNEGTLVHLRPVTEHDDGTYINANYVDAREALGVPFVYIATQAPMANTVLDFWRMVYENDVAFVVMLCGSKENGKTKSETYWPAPGEVYDLGLLSITNVSENVRPESVHRTLLLRTCKGDEKEVFHMQHIAWPDLGVPETSGPLMEMMQSIGQSPRSIESPIVVHCSGGVGRTGVFIAMHLALAQFQLERKNISIPRIVHFLKMCRTGMVQRKDQYLFLYYAVMREMDRMLLSAEKGVNLLTVRTLRSRGDTSRQTSSVAGASSHRVTLAASRSLLTSPEVRPMPSKSSKHKWSPFNIFKKKSKSASQPVPLTEFHSGSNMSEHASHHVPTELGSLRAESHRDCASDIATMEGYLSRVGRSSSVCTSVLASPGAGMTAALPQDRSTPQTPLMLALPSATGGAPQGASASTLGTSLSQARIRQPILSPLQNTTSNGNNGSFANSFSRSGLSRETSLAPVSPHVTGLSHPRIDGFGQLPSSVNPSSFPVSRNESHVDVGGPQSTLEMELQRLQGENRRKRAAATIAGMEASGSLC